MTLTARSATPEALQHCDAPTARARSLDEAQALLSGAPTDRVDAALAVAQKR